MGKSDLKRFKSYFLDKDLENMKRSNDGKCNKNIFGYYMRENFSLC